MKGSTRIEDVDTVNSPKIHESGESNASRAQKVFRRIESILKPFLTEHLSPAHYAIARAAIGDDEVVAWGEKDVEAIAEWARIELLEFRAGLKRRAASLGDTLELDGAFFPDMVALDLLRDRFETEGMRLGLSLGVVSKELWTDLGPNANSLGVEDPSVSSLWYLWTARGEKAENPRVLFPSLLARAIWLDEIEPYIRCDRPPAGSYHYGMRPSVPCIPFAATELEVIGHQLGNNGGLLGHKLFRWVVSQADEKQRHHRWNYRGIEVSGGLAGLARELKLTQNDSPEKLKHALNGMQRLRIEAEDRRVHGLLSWTCSSDREGKGNLLITIGHSLVPHYWRGLKRGIAEAEAQTQARMLVPLPTKLPPLVGPQEFHAAQSTLQMLFLAKLTEEAAELVRPGVNVYTMQWKELRSSLRAISVLRKAWEDMADRAGLPKHLLTTMLDAWVHGSDVASPFLLRRGENLYTLASTYQEELKMLVEAGQNAILSMIEV